MALNKSSKIFIAGHNGMVGNSILNFFKKKKYTNIFTQDKKQLDLHPSCLFGMILELN